MFYSLVVTSAALEVALRAFGDQPASELRLWQPTATFASHTDPRELPGVHGVARFTVNEVGLRARPLSQDFTYRLIAVGGSTTECLYLDDSEAWPDLLMVELNRRQRAQRVRVGNAGVSGHTTVHHLMLMKTLPVLSRVDALIFLTGANDLQATLAVEGAASDELLNEDARLFQESLIKASGGESSPAFKRLRLFHLARQAAVGLTTKGAGVTLDERAAAGASTRGPAHRARGPIVPLPDLGLGIDEYVERLERIGRECARRALRCIFLTQPSMWRSDIKPAEQRLLWFGWVGRVPNPRGYVTAADGAVALDGYNRALLETCRRGSLECYDLERAIPKNVSAFYDDFHFNEEGAKAVARFLAERVLPGNRSKSTMD